MAGRQCHKRLWWETHDRDAEELHPDAVREALFRRGHEVGAVARRYIPGGVLIDLPHYELEQRVAATAAAIGQGANTIYEASFIADGVFVAADILSRNDQGWVLTEVKATVRVKEEHLADVAVQTHVLLTAGLDVLRVELMHLNRACCCPDLSNLFVREDVTGAVEALLPEVGRNIRTQLDILDGPLPQIATGDHCTVPYECPFIDRCWQPTPLHHVSTLYRRSPKLLAELQEMGCETLGQIPETVLLGAVAARQRLAAQTGTVVVGPALGAALAEFGGTMAFLDFETVSPAIPVLPGCHPYDAVPVQFSCHVVYPDGQVSHTGWLADGAGDPRPEFARRLVEACRPANVIVAYNAPFEARCIRDVARAVPELTVELESLASLLRDLLPVVRDHVYHPDFGGSFSLKRVVPALIPNLTDDGLAVRDGQVATNQLERLLFDGSELAPAERALMRENLDRYCAMDTLVMVKLLERLRGLARSSNDR